MDRGAVGATPLDGGQPGRRAVGRRQVDLGRRLADQEQQRGVVGARQAERASAAQEPRRRERPTRRDLADAPFLRGDDARGGELAVGAERRRLARAARARERAQGGQTIPFADATGRDLLRERARELGVAGHGRAGRYSPIRIPSRPVGETVSEHVGIERAERSHHAAPPVEAHHGESLRRFVAVALAAFAVRAAAGRGRERDRRPARLGRHRPRAARRVLGSRRAAEADRSPAAAASARRARLVPGPEGGAVLPAAADRPAGVQRGGGERQDRGRLRLREPVPRPLAEGADPVPVDPRGGGVPRPAAEPAAARRARAREALPGLAAGRRRGSRTCSGCSSGSTTKSSVEDGVACARAARRRRAPSTCSRTGSARSTPHDVSERAGVSFQSRLDRVGRDGPHVRARDGARRPCAGREAATSSRPWPT